MTVTPLRLDRVVRTVGSGDRDESLARARVAALAGVDHPGVCAPLDVAREDDAVVVCSPRVPGVPLDRAGRAETAGEWAWLVAELAAALAALHERGLVHGDVSPANVIVGARPVLVDLVGPALGRERGTPGFAAPERAAGGAPGAAGDVHALGATCLAVAGAEIRVLAEAWVAPLLAADPAARPTAAAVARGIRGCATPRRWRPGDDPEQAAALARTETDPRAWAWRLVRRPWRVAAAACAVGAIVAAGLWGPSPPGPPPSEPAVSAALPSAGDRSGVAGVASSLPAARAARDLTLARVAALVAGDAEALEALAVPGSAAWATLAREARMVAAGATFEGLSVDVRQAIVVDEGVDGVMVDVVYALSAHARVGPAGRTAVPAQEQRARLTLAAGGGRWRVVAVEPAPVSATP